jgi:hypothetical protein
LLDGIFGGQLSHLHILILVSGICSIAKELSVRREINVRLIVAFRGAHFRFFFHLFIMDLLAVTTILNSITRASQKNEFDRMFSFFPQLVPGGNIRIRFYVLKEGGISLIHPLDVMYAWEFGCADTDVDFELVAALATAVKQ